MSVEARPRGEAGEELTAETFLPLGHDQKKLPSLFECRQTLRAARFIRVDTARDPVAAGIGVALHQHLARFVERPAQRAQPADHPPDEAVIDNRLLARLFVAARVGQRIADLLAAVTHRLAIADLWVFGDTPQRAPASRAPRTAYAVRRKGG